MDLSRLRMFANVMVKSALFKADLSVPCEGSFRANTPILKTSAFKCYPAIEVSQNAYFRYMYSP